MANLYFEFYKALLVGIPLNLKNKTELSGKRRNWLYHVNCQY
jgi:hypothetical protein